MIKDYNQNQGTGNSYKKKLLIPLFIIVLCMVSVTGEAYAYSTSVTGQDNFSGNYYSIDMYEQNGTGYSVVSESLTSGTHFVVQTNKTVGSNYCASVDETKITFYTNVMVSSNDPSACNITGTAQYKHNSSSADMFSAWSAPGAVTCDVSILDDESGTFETGTYYDVAITVTLAAIDSVDLGTADPRDIADKTGFDGDDCISISLSASR